MTSIPRWCYRPSWGNLQITSEDVFMPRGVKNAFAIRAYRKVNNFRTSFHGEELLDAHNSWGRGSGLCGCKRLILQYVRSRCAYLEDVLCIRTWRGAVTRCEPDNSSFKVTRSKITNENCIHTNSTKLFAIKITGHVIWNFSSSNFCCKDISFESCPKHRISWLILRFSYSRESTFDVLLTSNSFSFPPITINLNNICTWYSIPYEPAYFTVWKCCMQTYCHLQ